MVKLQTVSPSTTFDLIVANKEFVVTIAIITLKYSKWQQCWVVLVVKF